MSSIASRIILVMFLMILALPPVHDEISAKIGWYTPVGDAVRFIREHTDEQDFILYDGWLSPLVIYTGRGFVKPAELISDPLREEIRQIGFAATMKKYRIKYFFSSNGTPFYKDFAPLFEKTKLIEPGGRTHNRIVSIYRAIGQHSLEMANELKEIEQIEKQYDIPGKFSLTAKIGKYSFYSFLN